jgi:hypothetical protein
VGLHLGAWLLSALPPSLGLRSKGADGGVRAKRGARLAHFGALVYSLARVHVYMRIWVDVGAAEGTPSGMLIAPVSSGLVASALPGIFERAWWLPVGLLAAGLLAVLVGRVWGRHRLAAAGSWWELHLGERVSRPALEAFTRTLAGGLPRPLLGARPWVALSVSSQEDRAECDLFISGGLSSAQVRAAVEQALGGVTVEAESGALPEAGGGVCRRVTGLAPVVSRFLPLRVDHRVDPAGQLLASLRAQEAGEGGVVQLVLQAPARSASARARKQAARLRSGRGLQSSLSLRALDGLGSLLGGVVDAFTPGSPHPMGRPAPARVVDPFSLERARAIEAKAGTPLLAATIRAGAWATGRRRARGRLGGLLAAFG